MKNHFVRSAYTSLGLTGPIIGGIPGDMGVGTLLMLSATKYTIFTQPIK
jgi:hypothetical protein